MPDNPMVPCACGCGALLVPFDSRGRPRRFLPSHAAKTQPKQGLPVACEQCGRVVTHVPSHARRVAHHFCSQACAGGWAAAHATKRGARNGHYQTITVPCAGCGQPVAKAQSLINRRNRRVYCDGCIPTYARRGRPGFYVGYPPQFNATLRHRIRRRDNFTCQECNQPQNVAGTLHVHHIDYTKTNNDPLNLIALCKVCHGKTNWAMEVWQARFQALMLHRFPLPGPI